MTIFYKTRLSECETYEEFKEIIGDVGIAKVVGENFWPNLIATFINNLGNKKHHPDLAQGVEAIIDHLAIVLAAHFPKKQDAEDADINEIDNRLKIED